MRPAAMRQTSCCPATRRRDKTEVGEATGADRPNLFLSSCRTSADGSGRPGSAQRAGTACSTDMSAVARWSRLSTSGLYLRSTRTGGQALRP